MRAWHVLAWGVSLLASFYAGAVAGFNKGMISQLSRSSDNGLNTTVILRELRSGKQQQAIDFLEIQLDSQIAQDVYGDASYCSAYNVPLRFIFPDSDAVHAVLMARVLQYREEYPGPRSPINGELMRRLQKYKDAPSSGKGKRCWPM
jgi:hypothetical protein